MAVKGSSIGQELCKVLGLDANKVNRLVIDIPAADVATVEVTMFPDKVQGDAMTTVFSTLVDGADVPTVTKRYQLVDVAPPTEDNE